VSEINNAAGANAKKVIILIGASSEIGSYLWDNLQGYTLYRTSRVERDGFITADPLVECEKVFKKVLEKEGRIDMVVNLVGGFRKGGVKGYNQDDLVALTQSLLCVTAASAVESYKYLTKGGKYVLISSSTISTHGGALYKSLKLASELWCEQLDKELRKTERGGTLILRVEMMEESKDWIAGMIRKAADEIEFRGEINVR
jgi:NAD(P)-dependent dehydrogenase (short-subunit alcohol dehydrogenase family)